MSIWADADAWGFFVLGELSANSLPMVAELENHASCLGWICPPDLAPPAGFVGVRNEAGESSCSPWARFTVGNAPNGALPFIDV